MQDIRGTGSSPLLASALRQFAAVGFEGASLQRIADDAGLSKSSVLYHFGSKEALLEAALRPAVVALGGLLDDLQRRGGDDRGAFIGRFVDFLYEHRLAIAVIINHGSALRGHPVIDDADALVTGLSSCLKSGDDDDATHTDAMRFGIGLAGAAFMLVAAERWTPDQADDIRGPLTEVLAELVRAPLPA